MHGEADMETEAAVLGAFFLDEGSWDEVSDLFSTALFADPVHRTIAKAVVQLHEDGIPVDSITVPAVLRDAGLNDSHPAFSRTFELVRAYGTAGNIRHYVERLADLETDRALRRAAQEILADEKGTPAERAHRAAKLIGEVEITGARDPRQLGEVAETVLVRLDAQAKAKAEGKQTESLFSTGFAGLDGFLGGFRPGILAAFVARPGVGKSSAAVAFADNLAAQGIPVAAFWLEDEAEDFATRALQRRAKIASTLMRDGSQLQREHWERLAFSLDELKRLPIYVDDEHGITMLQIAARMRRLVRTRGVKVFMLDHLGEVKLEQTRGQEHRHDLALGDALRLYRDTAKSLGAAPLVFVQMNKESEKAGRDMPRMSDIFGSDQIAMAARVIGFLSRPKDDARSFVIDLVKNTKGPAGRAHLGWLESTMSVVSAEEAREAKRSYAAQSEEA